MVLAALLAVILLAVLFALPLTWVLTLAAGNLGFSQFGFADLFPVAVALRIIFGSSISNGKK